MERKENGESTQGGKRREEGGERGEGRRGEREGEEKEERRGERRKKRRGIEREGGGEVERDIHSKRTAGWCPSEKGVSCCTKLLKQ